MSMNNLSNNNCIPTIKSETEICPHCKKDCKLTNNEYSITSICELGHKLNYTPYEFDQTQFRHMKILSCKACTNLVNEDECYYCLVCKNNLCIYCKNHHYHNDIEFNNEHEIIKFSQKKYYCQKHIEQFISFCFDCEKDLCCQCEKYHKKHKVEFYDLNLAKRKKDLKTSDELFISFKRIFNELINKMISINNMIENTYKIYHEKTLNYGKRRTCQNLLNEKAFDINYFIKDFKNINNIAKNEKDDFKVLESIIKLHNKISFQNSMTFTNGIKENLINRNKISKEIELDILGKKLVENNKENCYIILKNKKNELSEEITINSYEKKNYIFNIQFNTFNNSVTNLSYLVETSKFLISVPDIYKKNTNIKHITNISYMFNVCILLKIGPDLSKFNYQNVKYISNIFSNFQKFNNSKELYPYLTQNKNEGNYISKEKNYEELNEVVENDYNDNDELDYFQEIQEKDSNEFFDSYFDFINESEYNLENSVSALEDNNINSQHMNFKLYNNEEFSSISYKSNNDSSLYDSLAKINKVLNDQNTIIINLIQVNINNKKDKKCNNKAISKKRTHKFKKAEKDNKININKIKFSFDGINFYSVSNIFKYISLIFLKYPNHLRKKFEYIKYKKIFIKNLVNGYNLKILDLLKYSCFYIFSSIYDEKGNVYISFLTNNVIIFFKGKGRTMVFISYPYGYLLANILYQNRYEFLHNLISL